MPSLRCFQVFLFTTDCLLPVAQHERTRVDNSSLIKRVYNKSLLFSMLMIIPSSLASIIDSIFVGILIGANGIAAYGLAMPTLIIINAVGLLLGNGGITLYLDHVGRGEKMEANSNFTTMVIASLLFGVLFAALGFFGSDAICAALGAKGDKAFLLDYASTYMKAIMLSIIPTMVCGVVDRYVRMDGGDRLVLIGTICMGIANAVLDYVLGKALGMWGIGLATLASYLVYLAIMCTHFLNKDNHLLFMVPTGALRELAGATRSGSSSAMMRMSQAAGMIISNAIVLAYGANVLAGASVRNSVAALFIFLSMGLEMATMLLEGMFYGERDAKELTKLFKRTLITETTLMLILGTAVFVFARPFASVFTHDPEVLEVSVTALHWYAISLPICILVETLQFIYQGVHNNLLANFISVMNDLILFVPAVIIMTGAIGVTGYWVAPIVANLVLLAMVFAAVAFHNKHFPKTSADWLMLRPDFENDSKAVWSLSIGDNNNDVVKISQGLQTFCEENGVDKKRAFRIALATEEMAGNIVRHAYKKNGDNYIDICAHVMNDGEVTLRLRDNGISFNPISFVTATDDEDDITSNIGIKLAQKMVKNMDYRYIGGLNNLLLTI